MLYHFTRLFSIFHLAAGFRRVFVYFSRLPFVCDFHDFNVYGLPLTGFLRGVWSDVLVFWSLSWRFRAGLALFLGFLQVVIGLAFKALWLLVLGLDALLYARRFDWDRYDVACAALRVSRGEAQS